MTTNPSAKKSLGQHFLFDPNILGRIVSLAGNIAPDGSASFYNVIFAVADASKARSFPMPLPVVASSAEEREMLHKQPLVAAALELAQKADVAFVGR